jgi:CRISPR-associated protein Cst2
MSKHLFGLIATHHGAAANNRGTNDGNITTLQKLLWNGEVHTTVSAEAIRWAVRYYWQNAGIDVNRKWDEKLQDHAWQNKEGTDKKARVQYDAAKYIDDDLMGFMLAEAAKEEGNDAEAKPDKRPKGTTSKRRGPLEITRAVSLTPFAGDITFNAKSGEKGSTSLYGTEVHATRYQYGFAFTPEHAAVPARTIDLIKALVGLGEVAGNHARFLYDFSPESIVLRWTDDFAPRMLYGFKQGVDGVLDIPDILTRIDGGDIDPKELIFGGAIAALPKVVALREKGAKVLSGVKAAAAELEKRVREDLKLQ